MSATTTTEHPEGKPYSRGTYARHRCRCDGCRAANAEAMRDWRARNGTPPPNGHGISGYTNYGCRCDACRRAKAADLSLRRRLAAIPELAYHDGPI